MLSNALPDSILRSRSQPSHRSFNYLAVPVLSLLVSGFMASQLGAQAPDVLLQGSEQSSMGKSTAKALRDTALRAQRHGKAMLVLLVPEEAKDQRLRGRALGAFLSNASDEVLLNLAFFELVCATRAQVEAQFGKAVPHKDAVNAVFMIVDTHRAVSKTKQPRLVTATLPKPNGQSLGVKGAVGLALQAHDTYAASFDRALQPMESVLLGFADSVRSRLDSKAAVAIETYLRDPKEKPTDALLVRAAAMIRMAAAAPRSPESGQRLLADLAKATKTQVVDAAVPGADWGRLDYCPPCGMGHVPAECVRFLDFFAAGEDGEQGPGTKASTPGR